MRDSPALYGGIEELSVAGAAGIRVERAVFPVRGASSPFLSAAERDSLWDLFQAPVYTLLIDDGGRVVAYECEAQDGLHLSDDYRQGFLSGRVESKLCQCGRPGPRLMPSAPAERQDEIAQERLAG